MAIGHDKRDLLQNCPTLPNEIKKQKLQHNTEPPQCNMHIVGSRSSNSVVILDYTACLLTLFVLVPLVLFPTPYLSH